VAEQFELLFAFVFSDFFPPFLFQVTHFNTSFIDFFAEQHYINVSPICEKANYLR